MCTKISIMLLYIRLFPTTQFILKARILLGIVTACSVEAILTGIFSCIPVDSFWDLSIACHCIPRGFLWFFNAALNIVTDLAIMILPIPVLSNLKLPQRQKVAIMLIFTVGIL